MDTRISLVTLGVNDLELAKSFYAALGWAGQEVEETVFIQAGPLAVVLWDAGKLAADSGLAPRDDDGFRGVTLAHNVAGRDEVDLIMATAAEAGARILKHPQDTFYGGYAGFFADLDGHVWEIAWNPGLPLGPNGELTLPDFST